MRHENKRWAGLGLPGWLVAGLMVAGISFHPITGSADDWPQWRGPQRDGVWRESGIVQALPPKLSVKWRIPVGAGYAGPAVANGKVFVTDRNLGEGQKEADNPFQRSQSVGKERVLCLDEQTGKLLWEHAYPCQYGISYPAGPRATPTIDGDKVYALGAMGDFFCLNAEDGKVIWSKNFVKDYGTTINTWGMSAAPLIDGDKVILLVGGEPNACVMALDKATGAERWRALQAADPGYAPPTMIDAGGTKQLIIWTPVGLYSLNPKDGTTNWSRDFSLQAGLSIPSPIHDPQRRLLFVTAFYNGPMMMQLDAARPSAKLLWKGKSSSEINTDGLHAIMCTPFFLDDHLYGICSHGQLRCLESSTGRRMWESIEPTGKGRWWNAFLIRHENRFFIANEQGELITANLTPKGYDETSRTFLIEPTNRAQRRKIVWSHPAFANRCVIARNDKEIISADLSASTYAP